MKLNREIIWVIYAVTLALIFYIFLFGFNFSGSLDIAMHDTYVVIANFHVLIGSILFSNIANLIFYGIKKFSKINNVSFYFSIVIGIVFCFVFSLVTVFWLTSLDYSNEYFNSANTVAYSLTFLFLGLLIMSILRILEIIKQRNNTSH